MKILILILAIIFLIAFPALAADPTATVKITFSWEQPESLADISGWSLYYSPTAGSGYIKAVDILYPSALVGTGPTFTYVATIYLSGPYGSTITKYFVATANGKNGLKSVYSNEVRYDYPMSTPPTAPANFRKGG
jgi:hypothetical protein